MSVIDYYFAPISGYAYLGHQALMDLAREAGAQVSFRPVDMGRVQKEAGLRRPFDETSTSEDRIADRAAWAQRRGLRISPVPMHHPADPRLSCRVILAAGQLGLDQGEVTAAILRGVWAEGRNVADPGDLCEALNQIDMPALEILRRAETEAMRDAADDLNRDAIEKRILHSPTYVVDGTRIDGQEHIDRLRDVLGRAAA